LVGVYPVVAGLLAAPALAVICRPLYERLAERMRRRVAALGLVIIVWLVLVVPAAWLTILAARQVPDAMYEVQSTVARLRATAAPLPVLGTNPDTLIARFGSTSVGWLSSTLGPALGSVGHGILNLSIALLGLYFLLLSNDSAWRAVRGVLPFSTQGSEELRGVFVNVTKATLIGTLSSAALQGLSIGIGLRVTGNSAPAFWGFVAGFATLVPVVGNALVWVPAVVADLFQRRFAAAVIMLVLGKVVPSVIDRVVRATISRRVGNTHPMVTLIGTIAGLRLVGPVGILIGPTIVQCSLALVQLYEREYGATRAQSEPA
jgi:predicted PurR-regulated permease PerM